MSTNRKRVLERFPRAKAMKLGRAHWKIAAGEQNRWLHDRSGNTAADAWVETPREIGRRS